MRHYRSPGVDFCRILPILVVALLLGVVLGCCVFHPPQTPPRHVVAVSAAAAAAAESPSHSYQHRRNTLLISPTRMAATTHRRRTSSSCTIGELRGGGGSSSYNSPPSSSFSRAAQQQQQGAPPVPRSGLLDDHHDDDDYGAAGLGYPPQDEEVSVPQQSTNDAYYPRQQQKPFDGNEDAEEDPFHETVQERVDHWRIHQQEMAAQLQQGPRDEQGRVKLLTSVGKGSRAAIFFFLMWRDIHLYEMATNVKSALVRLITTTPLIILFVLNMAGLVASFTSPSHSAKKRLKAILNLDKLVEVCLMVFALFRLTIFPSRYSPREMYIGNFLHSVLFFLQCQAFTRLSWDDKSAQPMSSYVPAGGRRQNYGLAQQQQVAMGQQQQRPSTLSSPLLEQRTAGAMPDSSGSSWQYQEYPSSQTNNLFDEE